MEMKYLLNLHCVRAIIIVVDIDVFVSPSSGAYKGHWLGGARRRTPHSERTKKIATCGRNNMLGEHIASNHLCYTSAMMSNVKEEHVIAHECMSTVVNWRGWNAALTHACRVGVACVAFYRLTRRRIVPN